MKKIAALIALLLVSSTTYAANVPISGLPAATNATGAELAAVVQNGVTVKMTTQAIANLAPSGTGTVSSVSVTTANGVSGSVANATTTPAITLTLGAITPSSITTSGNTTTSGGVETIGVANTTAGSVILEGGTSGSVTVNVPSVAGSGTVFTLPSSGGSNGQFLQTNGSGVTTWASPAGSGTITSSTVGTIPVYTGATTVGGSANFSIATGALNLGASGVAGSVVLNGASTGTVTIGVPSAAGTGTIFTLPATNGSSGQFLQTNGSGVTSWQSASGSGTVNSGTAGQMTYYAGTGTAVSGNANATISNGALTLGVNTSVAGSVVLNGATSGASTISVPVAAGTGTKFVLPATNGSNTNVLQTDGTGITSWVAAGSGGTINLGTSAAATNPQRSGQAGTGFFSDTTNTISAAENGLSNFVLNGTGLAVGTSTPSATYNLMVESSSLGNGLIVDGTSGNAPAISQSVGGIANVVFSFGYVDATPHFCAVCVTGDFVERVIANSGNTLVIANQESGGIGFTTGTTAFNDTYKVFITSAGNLGVGVGKGGNAVLDVGNASGSAFRVAPTASEVDYVQVTGGVTGTPGSATISVAGTDTNANLLLTGKGTGSVQMRGYASNGTTFTASGCSNGTLVGGATAGKMTLGANTCTVVITMNGATGLVAPNGWSCHANDVTTAAGNTGLYFSANSTTTATLTVPSTAGTTDVIDFSCTGF